MVNRKSFQWNETNVERNVDYTPLYFMYSLRFQDSFWFRENFDCMKKKSWKVLCFISLSRTLFWLACCQSRSISAAFIAVDVNVNASHLLMIILVMYHTHYAFKWKILKIVRITKQNTCILFSVVKKATNDWLFKTINSCWKSTWKLINLFEKKVSLTFIALKKLFNFTS